MSAAQPGPLLSGDLPETAITAADVANYAEIITFELSDTGGTDVGVREASRRAAERILAAAAPHIDAAARASERERIRQFATEKRATYPVFDAPGLIGSHEPFADLIADGGDHA